MHRSPSYLAGDIYLRSNTNPKWTRIADQLVWSPPLRQFEQVDVLFAEFGTAAAGSLGELPQRSTIGANTHSLNWYQRTTPRHRLAEWRVVIERSDFHCAVPKNGRVPAAALLGAIERLQKAKRFDEIMRRYR